MDTPLSVKLSMVLKLVLFDDGLTMGYEQLPPLMRQSWTFYLTVWAHRNNFANCSVSARAGTAKFLLAASRSLPPFQRN